MPKWDFVECDPLLDSSKMSVNEWNAMGRIISDNYDSYDGFVILHGTDTMAYSASALSFMLENLNKPVILTGSQIPLCETRSDGRDNMITSMMIAGEGKVHEVCIYFGGLLIRGNRAIKYSAQDMQAFISPNYPVSMDSSGIATCKKCGKKYDLNNSGVVQNGEEGDIGLQKYLASTTGPFGYISVGTKR